MALPAILAFRDTALKPVGVLTDFVVTVVARETDLRSLTVGDVMTRQPVVATEEDSTATALQEMRRIGVRPARFATNSG
jgi:CBS domain-containing protein